MISKEEACNYVNKGHMITVPMIERVLLGNTIISIFNTLLFIISKDFIFLIIYWVIFLLYALFTSIFTSFKYYSFKNGFWFHGLGYLVLSIAMNVFLHNALKSIGMFNLGMVYISFVLQVLIFILFIIITLRYILKIIGKRKHIARPYVSSASLAGLIFLVRFFRFPQEQIYIIINICFYISTCLALYIASKFFCKWYLVRKFDIKDYNQED